MGFWSKLFGSHTKSSSDIDLNTIAEEMVVRNRTRAVMEGKKRGLNHDDRLELFTDATLKVVDQLRDEYDVTFNEAIDAFLSTSAGDGTDKEWLINQFEDNYSEDNYSEDTCSKCGKELSSPPGQSDETMIMSGTSMMDMLSDMESYAFYCSSCGKIICGDCSNRAAKRKSSSEKLCPYCFAVVDPHRDPS